MNESKSLLLAKDRLVVAHSCDHSGVVALKTRVVCGFVILACLKMLKEMYLNKLKRRWCNG